MDLSQLTILFTITNSGGDGKTTFAEMMLCVATMGGLKTAAIDVDSGNLGLTNRNGEKHTSELEWHSPEADAASWLNDNFANKQFGVIDTGANMLASGTPVNRFCASIIRLAKDAGARVIVAGVTSPHKPGSSALVEGLHNRFSRTTEVLVVRNDRDGSGAFVDSMAELGSTIVTVPHISPGLQAVRLNRVVPLSTVIQQPEAGYERASAMIAKNLLTLAKQQPIVDLFGDKPIAALKAAASAAPVCHLPYVMRTLQSASNRAIDANERLGLADNAFAAADIDDAEAFLPAAREFREAREQWLSIR